MNAGKIDTRPISVLFESTLPECEKDEADTLCQAIARVAKESRELYMECICQKQHCTGGGYFVCGDQYPLEAVLDVYVSKEQVCANTEKARSFLGEARQNPKTTPYIHLVPGIREDADVHILLTDPAGASRIIGLCAYYGHLAVDIVAGISTCGALYRPLLEPEKVHLNLIDYYSRDHQLDAEGNRFYEPNELLLSMTPKMYERLAQALPQSAHGGVFIPEMHTNAAPPLHKESQS